MQTPGGPGDERKTRCGRELGLSPGWAADMREIVGQGVPSALAMFRLGLPVPGPSRGYKNELVEAFLFPNLVSRGHCVRPALGE